MTERSSDPRVEAAAGVLYERLSLAPWADDYLDSERYAIALTYAGIALAAADAVEPRVGPKELIAIKNAIRPVLAEWRGQTMCDDDTLAAMCSKAAQRALASEEKAE